MKSPLPTLLLITVAAVALAGDEPAAATKSPGGFDLGALDTSVDPCVDFYQFACGGWRKANPIPADETRWGRFNELAERNRDELHAILEAAKDPSRPRSPLEARVGDFYAACMDEPGIEARGGKPLEPLLARVAAVRSKGEFFRLLGEHEAEALPTLFRFGSAPDLHDSSRTVATVGQGGLSLPDRDDYLKEDAKSKEKRARFEEHVARMLELAGDDAAAAKAAATTVLRVETALAGASLDRVAMRDPKTRDNPMSVVELQQLAPAFDFAAFFRATGAPRFERLNVSSRKFFQEGSPVVEAAPVEDWKAYLRWHVVRASAPYLGDAFVQEDFRFNREYLQGARELEPRWKRCVQATDRGLGDALGQLYVEKTFGADGKARMGKMIESLTAALRDDIERLPWMTPETKKKALAKLEAFRADKVGYPDQWKDYSSVEVLRDDYPGNARRARVFEVRRDQARIDKPTDRTLWGMTPPDGQRLLQRGQQRDRLPRRDPPASVLRPTGGRRGQLRRDRGRDRARVHPRVRRPGQQVRRLRQPRELVDGRRPQGLRGAHGLHREAVRGLRRGRGPRERGRAAERPAHPGREHRGQRGAPRLLHGPPEGARERAAPQDRRLHPRAALLPRLRERLVPERDRGRSPAARADRPPLGGGVPGDRERQQHARVRRRPSAARRASPWSGRTPAAPGEGLARDAWSIDSSGART